MPSDSLSLQGKPLLHVRELTVSYAAQLPSVPALQQIDLDISAAEIVGILGESACGKSTLALALLGLLPAGASVQGSIVFQGEELTEIPESRWEDIRGAKITAIFQDAGLSLSPVIRVGDQILEVLRAHRSQSSKELKSECRALLREVRFADVDRIYAAYPHQLSGGELHRIAIAQALACRPQLLIVDEATRSLDVTLQAEVLDVLREARQKLAMALIFITHDPALLAGFADRVLVMRDGRVVESGRLSEVFRHPVHDYTKELLQLVPTGDEFVSVGDYSLPINHGR